MSDEFQEKVRGNVQPKVLSERDLIMCIPDLLDPRDYDSWEKRARKRLEEYDLQHTDPMGMGI